MSFSKEEVRTIIKFSVLLGKSASAIHAELAQVLGEESAPGLSTVKRWAVKFREGEAEVSDAPRSGRPRTATTDDNVALVQELLAEDRRLTVQEISLEVGISEGSVWDILHNKLQKRKKCARWVPHLLTDEHKACRITLARAHLRRFRREGDAFLDRIVTGDETWMRSYEPLLKRQSAEWRSAESPRPKKAVRGLAKLKTMHIVFYSSKKILVDYAVPQGTTVNAELYRWVLINKLRPAIYKKQPEILEAGPILLHDGVGPHQAAYVVNQLEKWDWEVLGHPPYSPDLSPCDFHLFATLKEPLRGQRFQDEDEINITVSNRLKTIQREGLRNGVPKLPQRWEAVITKNGEYIESDK